MSVELSDTSTSGRENAFDAVFAGLPPLDSSDYLKLLETASVSELPAQVLARAYRQLAGSGRWEAADATLVRLVADERFNYLGIVHRQAGEHGTKSDHSYDADDLVQETIKHLAITLPTERGKIAESAWVTFITHRFEDARRSLYGRRGEKDRAGRVEQSTGENGGDVVDEAKVQLGRPDDWHAEFRKADLPWLEAIIKKTIEKIQDPVIRYIARDQFGPDPSPISKAKKGDPRVPLTEQLGVSRFRISRDLKSARARLAAELITQDEREIDRSWLRKFIKE